VLHNTGNKSELGIKSFESIIKQKVDQFSGFKLSVHFRRFMFLCKCFPHCSEFTSLNFFCLENPATLTTDNTCVIQRFQHDGILHLCNS